MLPKNGLARLTAAARGETPHHAANAAVQMERAAAALAKGRTRTGEIYPWSEHTILSGNSRVVQRIYNQRVMYRISVKNKGKGITTKNRGGKRKKKKRKKSRQNSKEYFLLE